MMEKGKHKRICSIVSEESMSMSIVTTCDNDRSSEWSMSSAAILGKSKFFSSELSWTLREEERGERRKWCDVCEKSLWSRRDVNDDDCTPDSSSCVW